MPSLTSIALLGTLALLTSTAQSQMRGGGGGGMRGGGGGGMRSGGGGVHMSAPAARISSGRPMPSGPIGQGFRGAPVGQGFRGTPSTRPSFAHGSPFRGQSAPVGNLNRQNFNTTHVSANSHVFFFNNHGHGHFHSAFFHNPFIFHNGFFGANCFGTFAFGNPFCGGFVGSAFFFGDPFFGLGYGYGYPYGYPGYGYYPGYSSAPPDYYPQQSSTTSDTNEMALTTEIQRLSDEIDDLRGDRNNNNRDQQNQDQPPASSGTTLSAVPPSALTIFVLRDGRRVTAQNYAISGQTLWILNEHSARKTPLSDIDRAATEKANAANGVEIRLPEPVSPN